MSTDMLLLIIAVMTGVTTVIQCVEMWMLVSSSRKTNAILENPAPVIIGLMDALKEDKEFASEFGGLIAWAGQVAISGFKEQMQVAGIKPPKIKSIGDLLSFAMQMPKIQAAIEKKLSSVVEDKAVGIVQEYGL